MASDTASRSRESWQQADERGCRNSARLRGIASNDAPACVARTPGPVTALGQSTEVSRPEDADERAADRAADAVMAGMSASHFTAAKIGASVGVSCTASAPAGLVAPTRDVLQGLKSPAHPLPPAILQTMGNRFGADFAAVRLHTDPDAARSAAALRARAFTVGSHIVFGAGEYAPSTDRGQRLIAHELAHTIQHGNQRAIVHRAIDPAALQQCIDELGGSPRYRDGGIASPEELQRYREECERRLQGPDTISNLRRAWGYAQAELGPELSRQVEHLFSQQSLAAMAVFAALYLGSQMTPVGWIADAFALTVLTLTVIFVGAAAIETGRDLFTFFGAVNATSDAELEVAGRALARAIVRGGLAVVTAILGRAVASGTSGGPPSALAMVEVQATNGLRVPAMLTVAEAVQATRLQSIASYAVMVPPPGGSGPQAPQSEASSGRGSGSGSREGTSAEGSSGGGSGRTSGPGGGFRLGRIGYGDGPLSAMAQQLRLALNLRRGGNVAVFEFENIPPVFERMLRRLGGNNIRIEGNRVAFQNVGGAAHSEQLAYRVIVLARQANISLVVRRIYTEYNPCTERCLPLIQRYDPNAEVTYSFVWERWGREAPDRNAAVEALFAGAGR